jgi:hypothetical protein
MNVERETCEICSRTLPVEDKHGQKIMREFVGTTLCIDHYSQAKWPDTYTEINDKVKQLINDEV